MCGIVGYIGNSEKKNIILSGLKELEYRGYDSAGIVVLQDSKVDIYKAVGKLDNLVKKMENYESKGFGVAIGHTRWATHGKPTEVNAHPHIGDFSYIVHNGIIENYLEIKNDLLKKGYIFNTQTDTETIVHLFEENFKQHKDILIAFNATIDKLKGAFAILLISKEINDCIFYARQGAPLMIGKGSDGIYFASSDTPLLGNVESVYYIEEGERGYMNKDMFSTLKNTKVLNGTKLSSQKNGFRYFMEKEIYEQHDVLLECIMGRVDECGISFNELDENLLEGIEEIIFSACGTSFNASLTGSYLIERFSKMRCNAYIASELRYKEPIINKKQLFIVISQSGETADTLESLKLAKKQGLKTLAICNVDNSSIAREADFSILTRAGIEKGVASTKSFVTQVMVIWMFALYVAQINKILNGNELKKHIRSILESISATKIDKSLHEKISRLSKRYLHGHGFFFIGRDIFYPLALEGALKLKEISYLHAEGYPSGEMKHGPIALVDSRLFTIALMPEHLLYDKVKSNVEELSARDATICVISSMQCEVSDDIILLKKEEHYMPEFFSTTIALQLLALEIAVRLGNDVDMPRNLAKSVTVE